MKKNSLKRSLSLLLAFVLLATTFAACGKGNNGGGEQLSEFVYVPNYQKFPAEIKEMNHLSCIGDTIYFAAQSAVRADGTVVSPEELAQYETDMGAYYSGLNVSGGMATMPRVGTAAGGAFVNTVIGSESDESATNGGEPPAMDFTYVQALYSVKTDGTGYTKLEDYKPIEAPEGGYANLNKIIPTADGSIWVVENSNKDIFELPEGFDPATGDQWEYYKGSESKSLIRKLSSTGAEISSINVEDFVDMSQASQEMGGFYISDTVVDKQGNLLIGEGQGNIYVLNAEGTFQFKVTLDDYFNNFVSLKDGRVGVLVSGKQGGNTIKVVDVAAKGWGAELKAPMNAWRTSSGGTAYDFCYTDSSNLYGYDATTDTGTKILSWINSDVDGDSLEFSTIKDNGDVFAISRSYNEGAPSAYEVITLVKTPRADVAEKTTLRLATMWLDYNIKAEVLKFNKSNTQYRIEISDYSEYNTEEDYSAGLTKLNTEIISGTVPDLIQVDNLPWQQYAAKGLLEDIYPFIDNEAGMKREDFIQSVLKALEVDGKLFQLVPSFSVTSLAGAPDVVGTEMGWTMQELQQVIKDHPEADFPFGSYMTRADLFTQLCTLNLQNYMDWQTGECKFDSAEFKALMELAKTFPEKIDNQNGEEYISSDVLIADGRQLFQFTSLRSLDQGFQYEKAMFGGEITFKGFPSEDKKGNIIGAQGGISMTSSCKDKQGAWEFMKNLLSDEYQKNQWSLPISQKIFDEKMTEAMTQEYRTDENGNKVPISNGGMSSQGGMTIEFYALTQEEADQIMELINSAEKFFVNNESVMGIILEEVDSFFAGEKTVDEVASIIQSRMTIYINEQR